MPSNTQLENSLRQLERRAGLAHEERGAELATMVYPIRGALDELATLRRFFDRVNSATINNGRPSEDITQDVVDAVEKCTAEIMKVPREKKSLDQLAREREALMCELSIDVRYVHVKSGVHYIVNGFAFLHYEQTWGVIYTNPIGPVPFIREWSDFQAKFRKVPRG